MPKFKKKPVVVDAIQFIAPSSVDVKDFIRSFGDHPKDVLLYVWDDPSSKAYLSIKTTMLEGYARVLDGDWIIRGVEGEYYPCKNSIFLATYDAV